MRYEIVLLLAGIVLIFAVLGLLGLPGIVSTLLTADLRLAALAVAVELAFLLLLALRLKIISRRYRHLTFREAFEINTAGIFVGFLSPLARIGGEPVKIYLLKGRMGGTRASAAVAIDTLVEVFSLYIVVAAAASVVSGKIPPAFLSSFSVFLFLSVYAGIIFLKICTSERWLGDLLRWLSRFHRFSMLGRKNYAGMFYSSFRALASDRKMLLSSFSVSILTKLLEFLRIWIILLALRQETAFDSILFFWAFLLILSAIPFLPGGLGLVEGGGTLALVWIGIGTSSAASAMLIDRFVSYWLVLLIGLAIIWRSRFTYRFLRKLRH